MPARDAVEELYARHSRAVYRRARELLGADDAARDAVQEVFVRVIKAGGRVPAEPSPTAWLYRVTTNLCLNRLRDKQRQGALLAEKYVQSDEVSPTVETRVMVAKILAQMPAEVQDIAVYFFVDELSYDEIARLTGVSRRTVGNRLAEFRELANRLFPDRSLLAS
jgi:RNA polymerase sigma factor (sigma-70 family)